jgi:hypothetical protein
MKAPDQKFSDLNTLIHVLKTSFRQASVSEEVRPLSHASEQAILADEEFTAHLNMMSEDLRAYYFCNERAKNLAHVLLGEYEYFFVQNDTLYGCRNEDHTLLLTLDEARLS